MTETRPAAPRTTWPYWLGLVLLIATLGHITPVLEWWLRTEVSISRALNGVFGANKTLDSIITGLASNQGDKAAAFGYFLMLVAHCLYPRDRDERLRRTSFWFWCGVAFGLFFILHEQLEDYFKRESPSRVIDHWYDLGKIYKDEVFTRRKNTFPSGHASAWWFFAFMAMRRYHRIAPIMLAVAIIVPTARVFSGAHWMGDLLVGSVPLMLFASAIFTETPLAKGYHFCHAWVRAWWALASNRQKRGFNERVVGAFQEATDTMSRGLLK